MTKDGRVLTDEDLDRLADLAEEGFDLRLWKPRPGRPTLADEPTAPATHSPRVAARLPSKLHARALERAATEGRTISEVIRSLIEEYVARPTPRPRR